MMLQNRIQLVLTHASAPTASVWIPPMTKGTPAIAPMVMKATLIFKMDAKVWINIECQCIYAIITIKLHLGCRGPFTLLTTIILCFLLTTIIFCFANYLQMLMNAVTAHALQMAIVTMSVENTGVLVDLEKNMSKKAIHATLISA